MPGSNRTLNGETVYPLNHSGEFAEFWFGTPRISKELAAKELWFYAP